MQAAPRRPRCNGSATATGIEYIPATNITWSGADTAAGLLGAGWDLASITSAAENVFVLSLITTTPTDRMHVWIGGTDSAAEGTWTWTNGDPFSYTNWFSGEPNNSGDEDYLAYDYRVGLSWAWNDVPNDVHGVHPSLVTVGGYIVESPVPVPAAAWLLASALLGVAGMARRRKT
ncbi:MAG: hypothetical protein HONDAALG_03456 [Gammaproteobacteria bacterium]|nr:hypothetical protein [Gammaproteobacteria bacterium]